MLACLVVGTIRCGGDRDVHETASPTAPTSVGSTTNGCTSPAAPSNLTATVSGTTVVFNWSGVTGANDYMVRVGTTSGSSNVLSTNTTQTNYTWKGVDRGTYYARIEARNSCGNSPSSNEAVFTISGN
jgi:Fibronectin type III domain